MLFTTFFTITGDNIAGIVGYASDLVGNAMPLIVVILGIGVGIFIIRVIARLF